MIKTSRWIGFAAIIAAVGIAMGQAPAQNSGDVAPEGATKAEQSVDPNRAPELTTVSGRLLDESEKAVTGGTAFFIFQRRIAEIPRENSLAAVEAMAEYAVAIDASGKFKTDMAPGNYALVYVPGDSRPQAELGPGPESMAKKQRRTKDDVARLTTVIKDNSENGLPVQAAKLGEAYVIDNRLVRPPIVEFGDMILGAPQFVSIIAKNEAGQPNATPVRLFLRGKNGDIYEPRLPSASKPGRYDFFNVFPQEYSAFATLSPAPPGVNDTPTTPVIEKGDFVFDGVPKEIEVIIKKGSAE